MFVKVPAKTICLAVCFSSLMNMPSLANQTFDRLVKKKTTAESLLTEDINLITNDAALSQEFVQLRADRQAEIERAIGKKPGKQILFGDLHVHTTYSDDAFWYSLPLMQGSSGVRPPTSACNYARYVSQLDFFALTDHAESYAPQLWKNAVEAIRHCASVGEKEDHADLIAFMGYEWTNIGLLPKDHYGHHNVIFRDLDENSIPKRPVAHTQNILYIDEEWQEQDLPEHRNYYQAFLNYLKVYKQTPDCPVDMHTTEMPDDCFEYAASTGELFKKLREFGSETIVIPHGMAWGFSAPIDIDWKKQLKKKNHDNELMPLIEIYSGHGNSEEYRDVAPRKFDENGEPYCPETTDEYYPACRRAGEIIQQRCLDAGENAAECEKRAAEARQNFVRVNTRSAWLTVPQTLPEDWLDAGQVRDMFNPAFNYRPKKSAQAALSLRNFDDEEQRRLIWGFISSTDTHRSKAGHGFKQYERNMNIDKAGARSPKLQEFLKGEPNSPEASPYTVEIPLSSNKGLRPFAGIEAERNSSFMYLGGLAAVHAEERSRDKIFEALRRRETYATSGVRILLWFDMVTDKGDVITPMGGHVRSGETPRFEVTAAGSFRQLAGCPEYIVDLVSERGLEQLAQSECYHPSDERLPLDRIEVIRIQPQVSPDETYSELIDNEWKVFNCDGKVTCQVSFEDPDFKRDTVYYVRAIQRPTPSINAATLNTEFDEGGNPVKTSPCYDSYRTSKHDDCIASAEHRAWSSPIYVDYYPGK